MVFLKLDTILDTEKVSFFNENSAILKIYKGVYMQDIKTIANKIKQAVINPPTGKINFSFLSPKIILFLYAILLLCTVVVVNHQQQVNIVHLIIIFRLPACGKAFLYPVCPTKLV